MTLHRPSRPRVSFSWCGRDIEIEHQFVGRHDPGAPLILFLHDGLGCVSMWRDFPQRLCEALQVEGLVFSRYGYGHSTPRAAEEQWAAGFLEVQALQLIPSFLDTAGVSRERRLWLFGHSDGATIALLMAAHHCGRYAGVVIEAPHVMIEQITERGVLAARRAYEQGKLGGLSRHHRDADSVVLGWTNCWLEPTAREWNIVSMLRAIACPLLAIQGEHDDYGTMEQLFAIRREVPHAKLLELKNCGHVPHQDSSEVVLDVAGRFIRNFATCENTG